MKKEARRVVETAGLRFLLDYGLCVGSVTVYGQVTVRWNGRSVAVVPLVPKV